MKESVIQSKILRYLEQCCFCFKTIASNKRGIPDIIICYKGKFIAFEVKAEKGKTSFMQEQQIQKIIDNGGEAYVVRSLEEVIEILK